MASPLLRFPLCRMAQRSHLVWPGRGGFLQSRHLVGPPAAVLSSRAVARTRSFACLALARRLASSFRRRCRCFSAQVSHLVWPGIAGLEQSLHLPVSLAIRICSLRSCRRYSFRSGVWLLARSYSLRSSGVCVIFGVLAFLFSAPVAPCFGSGFSRCSVFDILLVIFCLGLCLCLMAMTRVVSKVRSLNSPAGVPELMNMRQPSRAGAPL